MIRLRHALHVAFLAVALLAFHIFEGHASEPYFNNDESRHTMTGVFFRDALADFPGSIQNPKAYAEGYYVQYPALGLLVWPPFFYAVEGLAMTLFGTGFVVGRAVVGGFALLMLIYSYRFARLTESHLGGLVVAGFVGLSPVIFMLSQQVMLEVPTLTLGLVAMVHFEKYLLQQRRRDVLLACLFASFCALTRFDGVFLLPFFALRLFATRSYPLLLTRVVLGPILLALLLTLPYYAFTYVQYGSGLSAGVKQGFAAEPRGPLEWRNWIFYPLALPELIGWAGTAFSLCGALTARFHSGLALALILAVYLTFSPLAELDPRHSVYWVPGLALLAWRGLRCTAQHSRPVAALLGVVLFLGLAWDTHSQAFRYVRGYEAAAGFVVANNAGGRPLFVDGELTGTFIYQVRQHDPDRRHSVLRGDKLLYSMLSDPGMNYEQHAATEADVLALLDECDPEWIVVEDPPSTFHEVPGSALLLATLKHHPKSFHFERSFPIHSNNDCFDGCSLAVYRKLVRNPNPTKPKAIRIPGLGRDIGGK